MERGMRKENKNTIKDVIIYSPKIAWWFVLVSIATVKQKFQHRGRHNRRRTPRPT